VLHPSLRELQDAYSETLDLGADSSPDTSGESDIESAEEILRERLGGKEVPQGLDGGHTAIHRLGGEKGSNNETELGDEGGRKDRRGITCGTLQKDEDKEVSKRSRASGSRLWKWGPGATSMDATVFFQRVV
jgi:hypothetical protein